MSAVEAVRPMCPPGHTHGKKTTCYYAHGCRCDECRAATSKRLALRTPVPVSKKRLALHADMVHVVRHGDGSVTIRANAADAAVIAASVLDRALAVEASRYTASSSETGGDAVTRAAKVERLRAIHKAIASVAREARS